MEACAAALPKVESSLSNLDETLEAADGAEGGQGGGDEVVASFHHAVSAPWPGIVPYFR